MPVETSIGDSPLSRPGRTVREVLAPVFVASTWA